MSEKSLPQPSNDGTIATASTAASVINVVRHVKNRLLGMTPIRQPDYAPTEMGIELVRGCNFSCRMCPVTTNEHNESSKFQFLDLDLLREMVAELDHYPSLKYIFFFHFGEPMAHPEFEECLSILSQSRVAREACVIMHTNGSLLHGKRAEAILNTPIIKKLTVSFDGWGDRESFERLRGPHFDKVVSNARSFAEQAAKRRPDLDLTTCSIIPKSGEIPGLSAPPWSQAIAQLEALFAGTTIRVEGRPMHDYNGGEKLQIKGVPLSVRGGCMFVEKYSLYLTVNGRVQPCCAVYSENFSIGQIGDAPLGEMLNGETMKDIRHKLRLDQRETLDHCKTCTLSWGGYVDDDYLSQFWRGKIDRGEVIDRREIDYLEREVIRAKT